MGLFLQFRPPPRNLSFYGMNAAGRGRKFGSKAHDRPGEETPDITVGHVDVLFFLFSLHLFVTFMGSIRFRILRPASQTAGSGQDNSRVSVCLVSIPYARAAALASAQHPLA